MLPHNAPRLLILCSALLLLFVSSSFARAAEDRGIFWLAEKHDRQVYLLGSIHLATADFYPLRAEILQAYEASDALVVEADILAAQSDMQLQQQIMRESLYPHGQSLRDELSAAVYQQLLDWLKRKQLPEALFMRQRPAIAMITLSMMEMQAQGLDPTLGIDRHFLERAHQVDKPILELEGTLQQLRLLNELENPDLLLQQTLEQLQEIKTFVPQLTNAWKAGDEHTLYELVIADGLEDHPEYQDLYEILFFRRNREMAEKIDTFNQSNRKLFVIVGAGHLVGSRSVIDALKTQGYSLKRH